MRCHSGTMGAEKTQAKFTFINTCSSLSLFHSTSSLSAFPLFFLSVFLTFMLYSTCRILGESVLQIYGAVHIWGGKTEGQRTVPREATVPHQSDIFYFQSGQTSRTDMWCEGGEVQRDGLGVRLSRCKLCHAE